MRSAAPPAPVLPAALLQALSRVRDPELDEAITELGFVADVRVDGAAVEVDLRLPTYFCAPNFAYLMVADAYDELAAVPDVAAVRVRLLDHFAAEEINAGVSGASGFAGSFPGLADGELDELRLTFARKAHRACQERVARSVSREPEVLLRTVLGAVPDGPDLQRLVRRRRDLGLPPGPDAPLLLHDDGRPIGPDELPVQLRLARATRVSIEGNSTFCRGLLAVRYGHDGADGAGG